MEKDILLLIVGLLVGGMNAIAGGGMLIGFPVLVAVMGLPPIVANVTGGVAIIPGQLTSAIGYRKYLAMVPRRYAWLLVPCVIGAVGGSLTLRHTSARHFAELVPLLVLFGVVLFAFQPWLHAHLHRHVTKRSHRVKPLVLFGIALVPLTFYGSYFGPGFGFMLLAFLGFTNLRDTHMMNAMKNVTAIFVAGTMIACMFSTHLIHWRYGLILALGTTFGGYFGARGALKVSSHWLRIAIICIGLIAVTYLGLQEY